MSTMGRRQFLGLTALATAGLATGCSGGTPSDSGTGGKLSWWDPRQNVAKIQTAIFAEFAKSPGGMPVDYHVWDPQKMGEALQLAHQSHQLPDVFTPQGVSVPPVQLVQEGWYAPIDLDPKVKEILPAGTLLEGVNVFDGKVYSLPFTAPGTISSLTWFNRDLLKKAGVDPDNPPATYDGIRAACRKIKAAGGDAYGWLLPYKATGRLISYVNDFASASGSPTSDAVNLRTGEYAFHDDDHIAVIDWWLAMQQEGTLFPSSSSLDPRSGRLRWASGAAGFFFDAQFCVGVISDSAKSFLPQLGLGNVPVSQAGHQITLASGPNAPGVGMWISKESKYVPQASALISWFGRKDIQSRLAEGMNAPPLYPGSMKEAKVDPLFTRAVAWEAEQTFLAPVPVVRNPDVSAVEAEMKPITPTLGDIAAGALSGDVKDYKGALKKLSDDSEKERERAIAAAKTKGAKVSASDWSFPDWKPGENYVTKPAK